MSNGEGVFFCSSAAQAEEVMQSQRAGSFLTMLSYDSAVSDFVLQRHVDRPLLLQGHKFHLRAYVAASCGALYAWGGLSGVEVRLAASKYTGDLTDRLQALTNFAPNRLAAGFFIKRTASEFPELRGKGLFGKLLNLIARTAGLADLAAATDPSRPVRGRTCGAAAAANGAAAAGEAEEGPECEWRGFALLALDIMVDEDGALWLLEVP